MDDGIGFLDAILSIFELCDPEKPECPRVTDWSIWDGSDTLDNPFDIGSLSNLPEPVFLLIHCLLWPVILYSFIENYLNQ